MKFRILHKLHYYTCHLFEENAALLDVGAGGGGADVQHVDQPILAGQEGHHGAARHLPRSDIDNAYLTVLDRSC